MKNRDDVDRIMQLAKHDNVGEPAQHSSTRVLIGERKLPGVLSNPDQRCAQGVAKLRHDVWSVNVVPTDCIDEVGPGGLCKEKPGHLWRPTIQLRVDILPRDGFAAVRVEGREPTVEFGLVSRG